MPKWAWWVLVVIAVIFIFRDPSGSGHTVSQAVHAVGTFIGSIH
jgi:hypothetical protein